MPCACSAKIARLWMSPEACSSTRQPRATTSKRCKTGGLDGLLQMSYAENALDAKQLAELGPHLRDFLHLTAESVASSVEKRWGVGYTLSGMTAVRHRLGYVCRKAKLEPGKQRSRECRLGYRCLQQRSSLAVRCTGQCKTVA
jgi:hypothetical protein